MNKYIGILLLVLLSSCRDDYCTQHLRTYRVINNLSLIYIQILLLSLFLLMKMISIHV